MKSTLKQVRDGSFRSAEAGVSLAIPLVRRLHVMTCTDNMLYEDRGLNLWLLVLEQVEVELCLGRSYR